MKSVLIHNNNVSQICINSNLLNSFHFSINSTTELDEQIHNYILKKLSNQDIPAIFIKASLSNNYLDFVGIRLALHVRFTKQLEAIRTIPIIIISELSERSLLRLYEYPAFLLSKGVFIIDESKIDSYIDKLANSNLIGCSNIDLFHDKVSIKIPDEFDSYHSISNEWSILQWSKLLCIKDEFDEINQLRKKFEYLLYYKYLTNAINQSDKLALNLNGTSIKDCKIKYIDDDSKKGWNSIFSRLFKQLGVKFTPCQYNFKDKTYDELESDMLSQIKAEDPDIIILDLRLLKDDFELSTEIKNISGYKLLKAIKQHNEGIQVLMFTASNKSENFKSLLKEGADGICIKEFPKYILPLEEYNNTYIDFVRLIRELSGLIFLKEVNKYLILIKNNFDKSLPDNDSIKREVGLFIELSFKLLKETRFHEKYFNYAYIQAFHLIELFVSQESIFKDGDSAYVIVNNREILVQDFTSNVLTQAIKFTTNNKYELQHKTFRVDSSRIKRLDTNFKISSILIFRLGCPNSSAKKWTNIYTIRNTKAAHYNKENRITKDDIFDLLKFIHFISDINNVNEKNLNKGLKPTSFEDKINEALQNHPWFKSNKKK